MSHLQSAFEEARGYSRYHPSRGYWWHFGKVSYPTTRNWKPVTVAGPDPSVPYVFGPPESGSFYHLAKIVRKALIPTALRLLVDFFSLKNYENVPSRSKSRKTFLKISFLLAS